MDFPKLCVNWIFLRKTAAGKAYLRFIFTHSVMCIRRIFPSASIDVHIFSTSNRFNNEAPNWIPVLYAIYVEKIHSNPNMWFPSCFTTIVDIVLWFDRKSPSSIYSSPWYRVLGFSALHTFYFRGFVDLVILLSLFSSYVVFVLKGAWLAHHVTLRKNTKTQQ